MKLRAAWDFLMARLSEKGSMLHVVNLCAAITGSVVSPDQSEQIVSVSLIVAGAIGIMTKES